MDRKQSLIKTAITSRFLIIILQYIANVLITDHDAGVFVAPTPKTNLNKIDILIRETLGGFLRWDAQHFAHIARYGYTFENSLAFFPLYPVTTGIISQSILDVFPIMALDTMILLVFIVGNCLGFAFAALALYNLTATVFNDENFAYEVGVLFCYNPASVFFLAPYTECLYSYLTFQTMSNCVNLYKKYSIKARVDVGDLFCLVPIALSTVTRSNGVLNIGFLCYCFICLFFEDVAREPNNRRLRIFHLTFACTATLECILPFIFYQLFAYSMFCTDFPVILEDHIVIYAKEHNLILPGNFGEHKQPWCSSSLPLAYSYVQSTYWNVGFMRYYRFEQLPNFALAYPALFLTLVNCVIFIRKNPPKSLEDVFSFRWLHQKTPKGIFHPVLYVFVVHALFLGAFCLLFVHVQVSTRMLASATPVFYWFSAHYSRKSSRVFIGGRKTWLSTRCLVIGYYLVYFFVGIVMFCNFLPWT